ncbi:hypothetical protein BLNAU_2727 [Blattamonas nauphoetae]|uniref:CN hydrolase domain-containing protein n=1 Tax=Blattamonas nauphoetae TaxID=2049346 RepID=A0ABQ9YFI2_9EUKA|nr:hypothetical protein BLNAU_2727 [Blattamonas nauphoetae]
MDKQISSMFKLAPARFESNSLLVLPEYGFFPSQKSKRLYSMFCQTLPGVGSSILDGACFNRHTSKPEPCSKLITLLAQQAKNHKVNIVAHYPHLESIENPFTLSLQHFFLSSQILIDDKGILIGVTHKHNLYGSERALLDSPPADTLRVDSWTTDMFDDNSRVPTRVGLVTCADMLYPSTSRRIQKSNVNVVAFSSSWMNFGFLPLLHATAFIAGISHASNITIANANEASHWFVRGGGIVIRGACSPCFFSPSIPGQVNALISEEKQTFQSVRQSLASSRPDNLGETQAQFIKLNCPYTSISLLLTQSLTQSTLSYTFSQDNIRYELQGNVSVEAIGSFDSPSSLEFVVGFFQPGFILKSPSSSQMNSNLTIGFVGLLPSLNSTQPGYVYPLFNTLPLSPAVGVKSIKIDATVRVYQSQSAPLNFSIASFPSVSENADASPMSPTFFEFSTTTSPLRFHSQAQSFRSQLHISPSQRTDSDDDKNERAFLAAFSMFQIENNT